MDKRITSIIKEWKDEARVRSVILIGAFPTTSNTITICTSRPGLMIGYKGRLVAKYKAKLKQINPRLECIKFVETSDWYIK